MDVLVHKFTDSHKIFCSLTGKCMPFSSYGDVHDDPEMLARIAISLLLAYLRA